MICEDTSRFKVCYDYVPDVKPLYNKRSSIVWYPYRRKLKKGMWGFPNLDKRGVYEVPMNTIDPFYLKNYINRKLEMLTKTFKGIVYIPFCFFIERLNVGIMLERDGDVNYNVNRLPYFLRDFKDIFPQKETIFFH